jgi:hypothetical protein
MDAASAKSKAKGKGKRAAAEEGSGEAPLAMLLARLPRDGLEALLLELDQQGAVQDLRARVAAKLAPEQARSALRAP